MLYTIPEPYELWERDDAKLQEMLERLPVCECCNNPIQQEKAVYYNDQWCCMECEDEFWQSIREDFLERTDEDD